MMDTMQTLSTTLLVSRSCMILVQVVSVPFIVFVVSFEIKSMTVYTVVEFQDIPLRKLFVVRGMPYFDREPEIT